MPYDLEGEPAGMGYAESYGYKAAYRPDEVEKVNQYFGYAYENFTHLPSQLRELCVNAEQSAWALK